MKKAILALGCVAIIAAIAYTLLVELSLSPTCDLSELDARQSPDGKHVASIFRKDCGATTDYVTGVTLRRADQSLADVSADAVLIANGIVPVVVRWIAGDMLVIEVPASTPIFSNKDKWRDIKVTIKHNDVN
jgi:hypothetical protein